MSRLVLVVMLSWMGAAAFGQQRPAAPAGETRNPGPVRSPESMGKDWAVPLCPAHFHDGLQSDGIAGPGDKDVTRPTISKSAPASITPQAVRASGKTHIGNYVVIMNAVVDKKGIPSDICLQKSSGYGLDAASAAAVPQYRFHPATLHGKPVAIRVPVEVLFQSQNPPETPQPIHTR